MTLTFRGPRVIDPASGVDRIANVIVRDGRVIDLGDRVEGEIIDADGLVLAPGFVDLHVHFREPGATASESVQTGARGAAAGGFVAVMPMANTNPATDSVARIRVAQQLGDAAPWCDIYPIAALTMGLAGEQPSDVPALAAAGVRMLSDDGMPLGSAAVMRAQMQAAATAGVVVCNHAQDPDLTVGAQANEGEHADAVDLCGWPGVGEAVMVARDILLGEDTGAHVHVPHVSTGTTVQILREAKRRGARVTAEAAPHHFTLTDELVRRRDPIHKVNPPLRASEDVAAVRAALADGTIDAIATDHAPHSPDRKAGTWEDAAFGMIGLETSLALTLTQLVGPGHLSLLQAVERLSVAPARIAGLDDHGGPIAPGAPANLTLFDPDARWIVDPDAFQSRSRNSPYEGFELSGRVVHTLLRGAFTFRDGSIVEQPT